jgi:hypothetical protein
MERLFTSLNQDQVRSIVETLGIVGNPLYPTMQNTRIGENDRKKIYSKILAWNNGGAEYFQQIVGYVTTPEFASKVFTTEPYIGTGITFKEGKVFLDYEAKLKVKCLDSGESLPLFIATILFMLFSKSNNGKVLLPKNHKGEEVNVGDTLYNLTAPTMQQLSSISNLSVVKRKSDILALEEQMGYKLGEVVAQPIPVEHINQINSLMWDIDNFLKQEKGLKPIHHDRLDFSEDGVIHCLGYCVGKFLTENPQAKVIVTKSFMETLYGRYYIDQVLEMYTSDVLDRIYYVSPVAHMPWYSIDFKAIDLRFLAALISGCTVKGHKRQIDVDFKNSKIIFGKGSLHYTTTLVRDHRDRWAHNITVVPKGSEERDTYHINSYGTTICGLIESYADVLLEQRQYATQLEGCGDSWYTSLLKDNWIPFNSEEECGGLDTGDRHHHLRFNTYPYAVQRHSTFSVSKEGYVVTRRKTKTESGKVYPARTYGKLSSSSSVDYAKEFYNRHNLVHMQKAQSMYLFDGRLLGLRFPDLAHITVETHGVDGVLLYIDLAKYITGESNGVIAINLFNKIEAKEINYSGLNNDAKWFFENEYLLAKFMMHYQYGCIVTKLSKNTQRVGLEIPSHAIGLDMQPRRIHLYEQIGGNYQNNKLPTKDSTVGNGVLVGNSLGQLYSVISLRNAIAPPGMGYLFGYIREILQKTKHEDKHELCKYNQFIIQTAAKPVVNVDDSSKTTLLDYRQNETDYELKSNGKTIQFYGVQVEEDELLIELKYKNAEGQDLLQPVYAKESMILSTIELTTNDRGTLEWEIKGYIIRNKAKLRQLVKLMITPHYSSVENAEYPEVVYNCLNTNADGSNNVPKVDGLLTGDSDKAKDSGKSYSDIAVETFVENGLTQYVEEVNKFMGNPRKDSIVWNQFLAMNGLYDSLINKLLELYGRSIWLKQVDVEEGMLDAVEAAYLNKLNPEDPKHLWVKRDLQFLLDNDILTFAQALAIGLISKKVVNISTQEYKYEYTDCTIITSNITKTGEVTEFDEVFIHYYQGDRHIMWQRTWGLVGNETYGNVYINLKVEMSLLDQNLSHSYSMYSTAECLDSGLGKYAPNHKLAYNFLEIARQNAYKWAGIQAMLQDQPIYCDGKKVEVIKVFGSNNSLSKDFLALLDDDFITLAKANQVDFKTLVKRFEGVVLDFNVTSVTGLEQSEVPAEFSIPTFDPTLLNTDIDGSEGSSDNSDFNLITNKKFKGLPKIWLPAVYAQSSNVNTVGGGEDSLSTLIYEGILMLIKGVKYEDFTGRVQRMRGACVSLQNSTKSRKRCYSGRKGIGVKIHAVLNTPVSDIWIAGGHKENIADATKRLLKVQGFYDKDGNYVVAVARSPIAMPAFLKVVMITPDDPRYILFRGAHVIANPLLGYISGGDYDGDMYILIFLSSDEAQDIVSFLTIYDVLEIIELRTGIGALDPDQEGYICDHWFPKTWKDHLKKDSNGNWKLEMRAYSLANFCSYDKVVYQDPKDQSYYFDLEGVVELNKKLMDDTLKAGGMVRTRHIGGNHNLAFRINVRYNLESKLKKSQYSYDLKPNIIKMLGTILSAQELFFLNVVLKSSKLENYSLTGWELYEGIPLGGLSWEGFRICTYFLELMQKGQSTIDLTSKELYAKGVDGSNLDLYNQVCNEYYIWYNSNQNNTFALVTKGERPHIHCEESGTFGDLSDVDNLIEVVCILKYRIARGVFDPIYNKTKKVFNIDLALALYVWFWGESEEQLDQMASDCIALKHLLFYLRTCLTAFDPQIASLLRHRPSIHNPKMDEGAIYIPSIVLD